MTKNTSGNPSNFNTAHNVYKVARPIMQSGDANANFKRFLPVALLFGTRYN